ncbi:MAG: class I SAM-dependent methyltransferase [Bacteroidales bacterium]|jgi:tRNA (cmo5U34)-methyltransferase|nr:class I SAM-dependent methyltransferase [Bacteroidales bacterium]
MNIKDQFNQVSAQYDSERHKLIPCLDDFYQIALENLQFSSPRPKVLDLGAGTGLFSQKVLELYPHAEIELVDLSDKMLEVAHQRFAGLENITITQADYTQIAPGEKYDAIISSLSIHHLKDESKQQLYKNIYHWLKPQGIFINADQVLAKNTYLEALYSRQWKAKVESTDLSTEAINAAYGRVNLDIRTPLNTQLDWLSSYGFQNVDCLYKYYDFVVIFGKKSK